jgi:hypothetical protein
MTDKRKTLERRNNPARKKSAGRRAAPKEGLIEFRVVPNGKRWDVERDGAFTGAFAYEVNTAIGLATAAAQRDQHNGLDVMVCVQQPDGHCRKVWP